jgi:hypothetical protein
MGGSLLLARRRLECGGRVAMCVGIALMAACASGQNRAITLGTEPTAQIQVGQTVHLPLPGKDIRWTATADETRLRPISGAGQESPANGWTWVAIKAGATQVVLNGRPDCPAAPCGTVPRIVIDVTIKN